ncbi:hypothetical protein L208DRAFT_1332732 [Tricholoma matsutake]|nr:hypothetical protein L208DRAFT_1332732 [Tricholoma matsutake 945]
MPTEKPNNKRPIEDVEQEEQGDWALPNRLPAETIGKKKFARRGTRSKKSQNARRQKYVDSGGPAQAQKVINNLTEVHHASHYPDDFVGTRKDSELVQRIISEEYPDTRHPEDYPVLPSIPNGILTIPMPESQRSLNPQHPPYLLLRLDSLLSPRKQGIILCAWDQVQATSPRHLIKHEGVRSTTPAYHWGAWEVTASRPYITMESHRQTPEAILSIDNLLDMVKKHIVAKIIKVTKEYLPNQWIRQERQRVLAWLGKELTDRPALDYGRAFFAIAVKEGTSEKIHIDWNDGKNTITWLGAVGDWEGAEFAMPQLGIIVPFRPGQVLGVMASVIAHFTTPQTSGR